MILSESDIRRLTRAFVGRSKMSENLLYHVNAGVGVDKNIFRPGSSAFFNLFEEARALYKSGLYFPNSDERELLESDIGKFAIFEGEKIPLDFPFLVEDLDEAKYKGREVKLGKKGAQRVVKGRGRVYVRDKKTGKIKKVEFYGDYK